MRIRFVAVLAVTLAAVPLAAQLDPLPRISSKPFAAPLVALATEPEPAPIPEPTLAGAARANDFATFDALFRTSRAEAYRPLHELWTYSVTDPIGAFYGPEMYERFARAYPRFAEYIADYRIIDSRGNVFYPSSETRAFLLAQAEQGAVVSETVVPAKTEQAPGGLRVRRSTRTTAKPAAIVAAATPVAPPLPVPAPAPAPVAAVVAAPPPVVVPEPVRATPAEEAGQASGRGLLLLIIGLIGTGVLALIVRTPREVPSIRNP